MGLKTTRHLRTMMEIRSRTGLGIFVSFSFSFRSGHVKRNADRKQKGVSVDNLEAACARFEELNVNWKKRLTDGRMKNVAFVLDPDGYWVEIVQNEAFSGKANF